MVVKLLQSLVQRGALKVMARGTGLDGKSFIQATMPANLSLLRHQHGMPYPRDTGANTEHGDEPWTALAVPGAGRSLCAGVRASIGVARDATRAVLSGWLASGTSTGKPRLAVAGWPLCFRSITAFGNPNSAPRALRTGPDGMLPGRAR